MKAIKIVLTILVLIVAVIYIAVFSPLNKTILVPIIKAKASQALKIKTVEVPTFKLSLSSANIEILLEKSATINLDANFSIFSRTLDSKYKVDVKNLSIFNAISGQKLNGTFFTNGVLKGKFNDLKLDGLAKIAKGEIKYDTNIKNNDPKDIIVKISSLDLASLLHIVNQPKYIDGKFNADANVSSLKLENLDFDGKVSSGAFNPKAFKDNLKINIPHSKFSLDTNTHLKNKAGDFKFDFNSQLAKLLTSGKIDINSLNTDLAYKVLVENLSMLEPIIKTKLNGSFSTNGTIKGDKKLMNIDGFSNLANGKTNYKVVLKNLQPSNIKGLISNAKIDKLLYMVNQPIYTKGDLSVDFNIKNLKSLDGKIVTTIKNGLLNKQVIKKIATIDLPNNATFNLKANTILDKNLITTNTILDSFVAKLEAKKTVFDIKTAVLNTDYTLSIANLANLYFVSKQKMRGDMKIVGDVKFDKFVTASFNSKKFAGDIGGTFIKDKLKVKIKNIQSLKLLNMMYYPEVFKSLLHLSLDYDITTKKGIASTNMNNGTFLATKFSKMLKKITQKDITTEIYKKVDINTKINDKILNSTLLMESKNSTIKSKSVYVNLDKSYIKTKIDAKFYKVNIGLDVDGALTNPNVKIDAGDLLKGKVKEKLKKVKAKAKEKIKDEIKKNLKGNLGGMLKSFL